MEKKVAILFSGRIRGYRKVLENLLNIKHKYQPIIFISLNETTSNKEINDFCKILDISSDRINIKQTQYPDYIINNIDKYIYCNPKNVYSMFYHNYHAFELIERYQRKNNIKFDLVLKYRADIDTKDIIDLTKEIKTNNIYIPNIYNYKGVNDQIAYGSYTTMKKYCNIVQPLEKYIKNQIILNGEIMVKTHLKNERIILERICYNYQLENSRFENN